MGAVGVSTFVTGRFDRGLFSFRLAYDGFKKFETPLRVIELNVIFKI